MKRPTKNKLNNIDRLAVINVLGAKTFGDEAWTELLETAKSVMPQMFPIGTSQQMAFSQGFLAGAMAQYSVLASKASAQVAAAEEQCPPTDQA